MNLSVIGNIVFIVGIALWFVSLNIGIAIAARVVNGVNLRDSKQRIRLAFGIAFVILPFAAVSLTFELPHVIDLILLVLLFALELFTVRWIAKTSEGMLEIEGAKALLFFIISMSFFTGVIFTPISFLIVSLIQNLNN